MSTTSGADLVVIAFNALRPEEQEQVFGRLEAIHLGQLAGEESTTARMLRSLQRAREHLGEPPNSTSYRRAWRELRAQDEEIEGIRAVIELR